jgi:hypothetical protein
MGRLILTLLGAAVLVLAPSPPFQIEGSRKIEQVRVYQRAVRLPQEEANAGVVLPDHKSIEEVVAFYRQRLGAVPVPSEEGLTNREGNSRKLHPGSESPAWILAKADASMARKVGLQ